MSETGEGFIPNIRRKLANLGRGKQQQVEQQTTPKRTPDEAARWLIGGLVDNVSTASQATHPEAYAYANQMVEMPGGKTLEKWVILTAASREMSEPEGRILVLTEPLDSDIDFINVGVMRLNTYPKEGEEVIHDSPVIAIMLNTNSREAKQAITGKITISPERAEHILDNVIQAQQYLDQEVASGKFPMTHQEFTQAMSQLPS